MGKTPWCDAIVGSETCRIVQVVMDAEEIRYLGIAPVGIPDNILRLAGFSSVPDSSSLITSGWSLDHTV